MSLARTRDPYLCLRCDLLLCSPATRSQASHQLRHTRLQRGYWSRSGELTIFQSYQNEARPHIRPFATQSRTSKSTRAKKPTLSSAEQVTRQGSEQLDPNVASSRAGKKTKGSSWTSMLKTNTLGAPTSVLVLRDLEQSRAPWLGKELESPDVKDVKANEILASLDEIKKDEGQEEVNKFLDSMRPKEEDRILSRKAYEDLIKTLTKSFNATQLEKYKLIARGNEFLEMYKAESKESAGGHSAFSKHTARLPWKPVYSARHRRGKLPKLAETIVREVWQCEVGGDMARDGQLTVLTDADSYRLLMIGGARSLLSEIGQRRSVQFHASLQRERGKILITGDSEAAGEAADAIERLMAGICEVEFDLSPFRKRYAQPALRDPQTLSQLSEQSRSIIELSPDSRKLIITSSSAIQASETKRWLLSFIETPSKTQQRVFTPTSHEERGSMWDVPNANLTSSATNMAFFGRFCHPFDLSNRPRTLRNALLRQSCFAADTKQEIANFLLQETISTTSSNETNHQAMLVAGKGSNPLRVGISLDFCSIAHPIKNPIYERNVTLSNQPLKSTRTSQSVPGLRQILYHFANTRYSTGRYLTVNMRPSPWSSHGIRVGLQYPNIRMTFMLEGGIDSRRLEVGRIEAVQSRREAQVLLPKFPVDLRFSREDALSLDPKSGFLPFMNQIQQSLSGYGNLDVPHFTEFSVPRILDQAGSIQAPLEMVEYFTASSIVSESIQLDSHPFELHYHRYLPHNSAGESSESLTLKGLISTLGDYSASSPLPSESMQMENPTFDSLTTKAEEIVKILSRNVGEDLRDDMVNFPDSSAHGLLEGNGGSMRLTGTV